MLVVYERSQNFKVRRKIVELKIVLIFSTIMYTIGDVRLLAINF